MYTESMSAHMIYNVYVYWMLVGGNYLMGYGLFSGCGKVLRSLVGGIGCRIWVVFMKVFPRRFLRKVLPRRFVQGGFFQNAFRRGFFSKNVS